MEKRILRTKFKDEIKRRLKESVIMKSTEEQIFDAYKDQVIKSKDFKAEIIDKFEVTKREAHDLYVRIINYQIKKYGSRLENNLEIPTKEEADRISANAKQRKYSRLDCGERQLERYKEAKKR